VWFHRFGSPPYFYRVAGRLVPWLSWPALLLCVAGLIGGLLLAPPDYQQGDGFRIMYVHVPSAWLGLLAYVTMASGAAVGLIWRMNVAYAIAAAAAPIGLSFTALTLVTGSLWGRPMWGTYWAWDPRLTSELLMLFLYLGYLGLRGAIEDVSRADRASAVLAVVGVVNVPIIHFSVIWWNSLHQAPSVMKFGAPTMPASMLVPLLLMFAGFTCYFVALLLLRARGEVLRRERTARWIAEALGAESGNGKGTDTGLLGGAGAGPTEGVSA
jgi:heme exporter protein C